MHPACYIGGPGSTRWIGLKSLDLLEIAEPLEIARLVQIARLARMVGLTEFVRLLQIAGLASNR